MKDWLLGIESQEIPAPKKELGKLGNFGGRHGGVWIGSRDGVQSGRRLAWP